MRGHIMRIVTAAVAGGAALLAVGLAGPATASAGTHPPAYPVIHTSSQAGYTASGRWLRFVATTVKVPAAGSYSHYAEVVLSGTNVSPVTLAVKPGGGTGSVGWAVGVQPFGTGGGTLGIATKPGDTVLIDLYYNRANGGVMATAEDVTTGKTASYNISEGKNAVFTNAEVACYLSNPSSPPSGDLRLWQFNNSAVTTYSGVHGTMTGPWTTSQVVDTTNGGASGQLVMSPSFLFNSGASFGAWLRPWLAR